MDNILQTALADAVNSLANFFGTTTEAIIAHTPEFLAKYGWYSTLNDLMTIAGILIVFMVMVGAFIIPLVGMLEFDIKIKHPILTFIGVYIIFFVFITAIKIVTCAVAPEIVGAHAIMDLLKNMK